MTETVPGPFTPTATDSPPIVDPTMPASIVDLRNLEQVWRFATMVAGTNLVPDDFRGKPEEILIAVQWGVELGVAPLQALQNIAVINNRPSIWGALGRALVIRQSDLLKFDESIEGEGESMVATCTIERRLASGEVSARTSTFSWQDAKRVKQKRKNGATYTLADKETYRNYPEEMLGWRAFWKAARRIYADVFKGLAAAEESQDLGERVKPAEARTVATETPPTASSMEALAGSLSGDPAMPSEPAEPEQAPAAEGSTEQVADSEDDRCTLQLAISNLLEQQAPDGPEDAAAWLDRELRWGGYQDTASNLSLENLQEVYSILQAGNRVANAGLRTVPNIQAEVTRLCGPQGAAFEPADFAEFGVSLDLDVSNGIGKLKKDELLRLLDGLRDHIDMVGG